MDFLEVLEQAREVLQRKGRMTYRALKRQFALDDDYIEDLKAELIKADRVARDEDGEVLVWIGDGETKPASDKTLLQSQPPSTCTPPDLAERIRAEQQATESRGQPTASGKPSRPCSLTSKARRR